MSTAEFGDLNLGQAAPAPAPAPESQIAPLTLSPPAPVEAPAVQPAVTPPAEAPPAPMPVADMRDVPLGTLIFREGLLTEEQLEEALQDGMKRGKRLGEVLLERGLVSENDLGRLLAGQKGLQFVQLDAAAVDPAAVQLLPVEKARLHSVLPIGFQDGLPVVAVADPSNDLVIENVRRALNCEPLLVVAGREALHRQIEAAYGAVPVAPAAPEPVALPVEPVAPVVPEALAPVAVEPIPPVAVEPVAPVVEPVMPAAPLAVEPVAAVPVAPPVAPVVAEPALGEGVWLGTPEAVAEPAPVVQPDQPAFQPEPAVQPGPVSPAPVAAEPVAVSYTPEPVVEEPYRPLPAPEPVVEPVPPVLTEPEPPAPEEVALTCWVVVRLTDGQSLDVGGFRSSADAKEHAKNVVEQISSDTEWPFYDGRFIRPEAVVSVDLVEAEGRWLGSAARRAAWDARNSG